MILGNSLILQMMKLAQKEAFAYPRSQSKSAAEPRPEAKLPVFLPRGCSCYPLLPSPGYLMPTRAPGPGRGVALG